MAFPLRTKNRQQAKNDYLTGKAPYKSANFWFLSGGAPSAALAAVARDLFDRRARRHPVALGINSERYFTIGKTAPERAKEQHRIWGEHPRHCSLGKAWHWGP